MTDDLTVPRVGEAAEKPSAARLAVLNPTALAELDTERVQSASANGAFANLPDAQWSDALPKLVQVKILRSIENAGRFSEGSRPLDGLATDFQLVLEIRKFQLAASGNADAEFGCKIVASSRRIIAMRVFRCLCGRGGQCAGSGGRARQGLRPSRIGSRHLGRTCGQSTHFP